MAQGLDIEETGFERVIQVGSVVSDFVHAVYKLCLKGGTQLQKIFAKFREIRGAIIARMLYDAFANFEGQVQAGEIEVALFEMFDDAQGVKGVIEAPAMSAHHFVEVVFASMAKWRMANVM